MCLRGPSTKTALTFLTAIMVLEILKNVGKHFLQKISVYVIILQRVFWPIQNTSYKTEGGLFS